MLALILMSMLSALASARTHIHWASDNQGYSGPIAIMALDNNWNGTFKDDEDGFLWQQDELRFTVNDAFSISYLKRHHAEYTFPTDVARGFYYQNNDITLTEPYDITSRIHARHYQGEGLGLGYRWQGADAQQSGSIRPTLNWLKLHRLVWGTLNGDLYYQSPNHWGGDVALDYAYTRDYVVRRPLDGHTYGNLLELGLEADYRIGRYSIAYQGHNLWAQIRWKNAPATQAQFCTRCTFLLFGREFYDDLIVRPTAVHQLTQRVNIGRPWQLGLIHRINRIRNSHAPEVSWQQADWHWQLGYEPDMSAWRIGVEHPAFFLQLQSDSLNTNQSRLLRLSTGFTLAF